MLTICEQHSKNIYTLINVTHKLSSLSQITVLGTQGDIKVPQRERTGASHMWVTKNDLKFKIIKKNCWLKNIVSFKISNAYMYVTKKILIEY